MIQALIPMMDMITIMIMMMIDLAIYKNLAGVWLEKIKESIENKENPSKIILHLFPIISKS